MPPATFAAVIQRVDPCRRPAFAGERGHTSAVKAQESRARLHRGYVVQPQQHGLPLELRGEASGHRSVERGQQRGIVVILRARRRAAAHSRDRPRCPRVS